MEQNAAAEENLGRLEVQFVDGSSQAATVIRRRDRVYLTWPQSTGVPFEHLLREGDDEGVNAWVREVSRALARRVKYYNYAPTRR
ncbi:MAG: hypothetical protein ABIL09_09915 [Gemmatimonadota bacterium]